MLIEPGYTSCSVNLSQRPPPPISGELLFVYVVIGLFVVFTIIVLIRFIDYTFRSEIFRGYIMNQNGMEYQIIATYRNGNDKVVFSSTSAAKTLAVYNQLKKEGNK